MHSFLFIHYFDKKKNGNLAERKSFKRSRAEKIQQHGTPRDFPGPLVGENRVNLENGSREQRLKTFKTPTQTTISQVENNRA